MARALLTLVGGIVLAVLLAAVIAGPRDLGPVLGPVLITTAISGLFFAVVARRARTREAADELRDQTSTTTQEPDRG